MRKQFAVALVVLSLLSSNAWALTLNEARTQGRVGETLNGYLVALQTDAETQALVSEINKARNASYQQLAESNNIPPDEVAKMAGQKLVARAKPGEYVQGIMVSGCGKNKSLCTQPLVTTLTYSSTSQ